MTPHPTHILASTFGGALLDNTTLRLGAGRTE